MRPILGAVPNSAIKLVDGTAMIDHTLFLTPWRSTDVARHSIVLATHSIIRGVS
jgi:hypothetical protein